MGIDEAAADLAIGREAEIGCGLFRKIAERFTNRLLRRSGGWTAP